MLNIYYFMLTIESVQVIIVLETTKGGYTLNVKYLFDYVKLCKSINIEATWKGLKHYYYNNKGVY